MVSSTAGMDWFRRRYLEAKQADDARNTLIEDLLQKVDDMQKTMERNAFVLVLIDGDNMNVSTSISSNSEIRYQCSFSRTCAKADYSTSF